MMAKQNMSIGVAAPVGVIVVAAGAGRRMGGMDKVFAPLFGVPLIARTVEVFEGCPQVGPIVLVLRRGYLRRGKELAVTRGWRKVVRVCPGGPRRQDSVRMGLGALPACRWVMVHDGARPCIEPELLRRGLREAHATGAAVAAVPVKDTVKVVSPPGVIQSTPARSTLWAVQTPQVFRRDLLERAHQSVTEDVTDDATMVERLGTEVRVFLGSYANIKVTTPEDLSMAEALLRQKGERCG